MELFDLPPRHLRQALDEAVDALNGDAEATARLQALADALAPDLGDAGQALVSGVLGIWLVLGRVYGLGADAYSAFFYVGDRILGLPAEGLLKCVETGEALECFVLTPGGPADQSGANLHLACPSPAFVELLHPST